MLVHKLNLLFTNPFINSLPEDKVKENYQRQVEHAAFSYVTPKATSSPSLVAMSDDVASLVGISKDDTNSDTFIKVFSGNELIEGMSPYAMCYGGFQFGQWAGQLGDGRAINLGEVEAKSGTLTLQLKGAGPTPYSRTADGLAVLRSSVREFLCSEAMHHLGIPTTRALSLCLTGDHVIRDMMYDGNAKPELGAVVCRVSPSFMRFGSFQLPAMRQDSTLLKQMVDYCIRQDFSHLVEGNNLITKSTYLAWFNEVSERTADMVIDWMRVGFVHGVMNTDNMSIIGETIDYGPYGWIDNFDLGWTPNTTDRQNKRYRFGAQANVALWNLCQLANSIIPIIGSTEELQAQLDEFGRKYEYKWHKMMASKLGLSPDNFNESNDSRYQQDEQLFKALENILSIVETDMTIFYRLLAQLPLNKNTLSSSVIKEHFDACFYEPSKLTEEYTNTLLNWLKEYQTRVNSENIKDTERQTAMNTVNPKYVLRNYLSQIAIDKANLGDYSEIHALHELLKRPYDEQPENEKYFSKRPEWAKDKVGCSMLSCSS